jgi:Ca2+-binding RTX toxin-like protein
MSWFWKRSNSRGSGRAANDPAPLLAAAAGAACEALEGRTMMSVSGSVSPGHTLTLVGDLAGSAERIVVTGSGTTVTVKYDDGTLIGNFAGVSTAVYVDMRGGNDKVDLTGMTNGLPTTVIGNAGNDTLFGTGAADYLEGDAGADWLDGNGGNDVLAGGSQNDVLDGGNGDDRFAGGDGDDVLNGESGADRLDGGAGADDLNGGPNGDVADYSGRATLGVSVRLDNVNYDGSADDHSNGRRDNVAQDVEHVRGTQVADYLEGSAYSNELHGLGGDDVIVGLGGADFLLGGAGADDIYQNNSLNHADGAADQVFQNDAANADDSAVDEMVLSLADDDLFAWSQQDVVYVS